MQNLEEKERKAMLLRDQLECENRHLRRRLHELNQLNSHSHNLYRLRQERSISECSTSTNSSSSSSTSSLKSEESGKLWNFLFILANVIEFLMSGYFFLIHLSTFGIWLGGVVNALVS